MLKYLILLLALSCAYATVKGVGKSRKPTPVCKEGEEYTECGSACPATCDNRGDNCTACIALCVEGCFCKKGLVRAANGSCIPPERCPEPVCDGANEHFVWCPPNCPHQNCSALWSRIDCRNASTCCKPQCRCIDGYYRNNLGKCISSNECIHGSSCGPNSHYNDCGTACPLTCEEPKPRACTEQCVAGCECDDGYVKDQDGNCIKLDQCPQSQCGVNETYVRCQFSCPTDYCKESNGPVPQCSPPYPCPPGCRCKSGYRKRREDEKCIKETDCPPPVICEEGEHFERCGTACPPRCDNLNPKVCTEQCVKGCFCNTGLIRDHLSGKCIPPEKCPATLGCGKNEHFEKCGTACPPTCNDRNPQICTKQCVEGCFCDDGYIRDTASGKCILPKECPAVVCKDPNEVKTDCYTVCADKTCKDRIKGSDRVCHTACIETGCICKKDYYRHDNGTCVPARECSPPRCDSGEKYTQCGSSCPDTCSNRGDTCRVCTLQCVEGCFCKEGTVRAANNSCVPPSSCPKPVCNGPNEKFDWCPPNCPHQNCSAIWSKFDCSGAPDCCKPQCRCIDGYYRNKKGICISAEECIKGAECGPHSSFNRCGTACPLTCDKPFPRPCTKQCNPGCQCDDGYIKDKDGNCIKPEECPTPVCKAGEEYTECGSACPATCDNRGDNCAACIALCVKGCFCKKGLVRAANGSCIPPERCPEPVCDGANEHFVWCPPNCPHQNCSALWSRIDCRNASTCCKPRCRCIDGYYRNDLGKCISSNECIHGSSCGPNSHYNDCGTACPLTCEEPKPRACTRQCVAGCECDDGYVKDKDGNCIKLDKCPQSQCGVNETYAQCKFGCSTDYCKESNSPDPLCLPQNPCPPGCRCKPGYLKRREDGQCINKTDCPPPVICKEGEHFESCGTACPPRCDNKNPKVCTDQCVKGCFCDTGLIRDHISGKCILPEKCPATESCGKNEHFEECGTACPRTCKNRSPQICTYQCVRGCFCDDGYVRDTSSGRCVLPKQCPPPRCRSDEEYLECGSSCPDTCSNRGDTCRVCTSQCVKGCFCKEGTVRAANGSCIPPSRCPKPVCKGPKEYFDWCPPNCPHQNCSAIWSKFDCSNASDCCKPQCRCKDGYYRNNNGVCVSGADCLCGDNAHYNKCASACPLTCEQPNPRICTLQCVKGCECDKGFVRNSDGQCVKPEDCPIECGENEVYNDVSIVCPPQTCDSIYTTYDCTYAEEGGPGCDCLPGYLRNGTLDDPCIPSEQCPVPYSICPDNEEWNDCGTNCPKTCENKDKPIICLAICVEGCFCKNGFVRNDDGLCVPPSECKPPVCPINEEWNTCGSACPPTCDTLDNPVACVAVCVEGCFCKRGLVRNSNGLCVPPHHCRTCPVNEEWRSCGSACPTTCNSLQTNKTLFCPAVCVQGCFCKKGFIRNDEGICVPPEKCYPNTCPANEEWKTCGTACPKTCKNKDLAIACISVCIEGCFCKKGLVRNDEGICVLPEQCTPKCKANEVYSNCSIVCPPQTCASIYTTYLCENSTKCTPGCNCIDGYLRNGSVNDPCIPSDQCPPTTPVCPKNEVWNSCGTACPKTCKNRNAKIACIEVCKEGCFCRDDLVRNDDGVCVPPEECPQKCPKNQEWISSGTRCPKTCANKDKQIKCIVDCKAGCFCKNGLVLNDDGTCVDPKKCDKPIKECSEDEKWSSCGTACPRTCKNKDEDFECIEQCKVGCFCRKGLVRNDEGNCVDPEKCKKPVDLCPENEEWNSCGTACPKTCKNKDIKINCTAVCKEGCFCKKGLVRNDAGICINPKKCPVTPRPGYNNPKQVGPQIFP